MQSLIVNSAGQPFDIEFESGENRLSEQIVSRHSDPDFQQMSAYLPNPDEVLKKNGDDIAIYESMLGDSEVWSAYEKLINGTMRHSFALKAKKSSEKITSVLTEYFEDFKWSEFVSGVLRARLFGHQPMEIIWEEAESHWLPNKIDAAPLKRFVYSPENQLLLRTKDKPDGIWKPEWDNSFIVPKYHATSQNPYGTAVLAKCFWNVTAKRAGLKWWIAFLEKYATPWVIIYHKGSATIEEKRELAAAGQKAIQDAVIVLKDTAKVEIKEPPGKGVSGDLYERFTAFHDKQISKAITSETLTSDVGAGGSYAAANTHESILDTAISACVGLVKEAAQDLVNKTEMVNYGTGVAPVVQPFDPMYINKGLAERDEILSRAGVKFTKKYFIIKHGFAEDEIEVEAQPADDKKPDKGKEESFATDPFPDQTQVDNLGDKIFNNETLNKKIVAEALNGILAHIDGSESFESAMEGLAALFPTMKTDTLEHLAFKTIAAGKVFGMLSVENENVE